MSRSKLFLTLSLMMWSFTAVVLSNAYTGKIVSQLLVPKRHPIIDSLEQLPTSPLSWIVRRGTAGETLFLVVALHFGF